MALRRGGLLAALSAVCLAAGLLVAPGAPGADSTVNLAWGQPTKASSQEGSAYAPANAVDGSDTTRWSSGKNLPSGQWIWVDLGAVRPINRVLINWEAAWATSYEIRVSTDDANWPLVATDGATGAGWETTRFPTVNARWVAVAEKGRAATRTNVSMWELEVYNDTPDPDPTPTPTPTPSPTPTPGPGGATTLWTGDMEEGTLADWDRDGGGGEFNTPPADSTASTTHKRSGSWSARMTWQGSGGQAGTRLFRWRELNQNRDVYVEKWLYFPTSFSLTGSGGRWQILDEFKSRTCCRNDPFWYVQAIPGTGGIRPVLTWGGQSGRPGPHAGEGPGFRNYQPAADVFLPVGRWFKLTSFIRQSKDFDGIVRYWLDDRLIHEQTNVRTGHVNDGTFITNAWGVDQHWAVTNYSDGITPNPWSLFVDDVRISR